MQKGVVVVLLMKLKMVITLQCRCWAGKRSIFQSSVCVCVWERQMSRKNNLLCNLVEQEREIC